MQRIVMLWTVSDGCSYSCDNVLPLLYESPEAALVDFETILRDPKGTAGGHEFQFSGHSFSRCDFRDGLPDFLTVDEWFARGT